MTTNGSDDNKGVDAESLGESFRVDDLNLGADGLQLAKQLLGEQRALLLELKWAYKQAVMLDDIESMLHRLDAQLRLSREESASTFTKLDQRLRKQQVGITDTQGAPSGGGDPQEFARRFDRLSRRTQRIEATVRGLAEKLEGIETVLFQHSSSPSGCTGETAAREDQ